MKHLLVALIIFSFLVFPIPRKVVDTLDKDSLLEALNHMLNFFKTVTQCEHAGYVEYHQEGENVIFVIECKDKEA